MTVSFRTADRETYGVSAEEMVESLTEALPKIRDKLGLSQKELGEKLGITRQTVSGIERRVLSMSWSTFLAIVLLCMANGVDIYFDEHKYIDILKEILCDR